MSVPTICPCDGLQPVTIYNQPDQATVSYRIGDFRTFRQALLQPRAGEVALLQWRPALRGDLALQIVEWCAYIADVLAFYNERSLNGNLLGTSPLDADVRALIRILGYRPRPGIGGSGVVAALLNGPRPAQLATGFQIQSKPGPGQQPQTFETTKSYSLSLPDAVPAAPPGTLGGPSSQLYLVGTIKSIQPGDMILLAPLVGFSGAMPITVQAIQHLTDSGGTPYTEIAPAGSPVLPTVDAGNYRLLRSARSAGLWKYTTVVNKVASPLALEGVDRGISAGQVLILTAPGTSLGTVLLHVTGTSEELWYTNGDADTPPPTPTPPAGSLHTRVSWNSASAVVDTTAWNNDAAKVRLLLDWRPSGTLRNAPVSSYSGNPKELIGAGGHKFQVGSDQTILIEGADGTGVIAKAAVSAATSSHLTILSFPAAPIAPLPLPLRVLHNVVEVSRGKSVEFEHLGTGNSALPVQEFVLQKSPLTYLPAGDGYRSTLALFVDGVEWTEVSTLYRQPATAQVFVTFEDDEQKTHVRTGDGVNGLPFPTGAPIVARYRVESGLDAPQAGALTTIARPNPGVRSVRNPVVAGGGSDPDPIGNMRRYAPRSVLTFGRAISADDYEAIAANAPGVARVRAYYAWDADQQRATVTLYVGDTAAAVSSARNALVTSADPNRAVTVLQATAVPASIVVAIRVKPGHIASDVAASVRASLADPDSGLLGVRHTGIGEGFYFSQLSDACHKCPGVEAMTSVAVLLARADPQTGLLWAAPPRINTSIGEFMTVAPEQVAISTEVLSGA